MVAADARAYLVNTGWNGSGNRISIKATRAIINAILDGSIDDSETAVIPYFNLSVPTALGDIDPVLLDPRKTYSDQNEWDTRAKKLASLFVENFDQYTDNHSGKALVAAGPQL